MSRLRQLSPSESLFIGGETATVYQHTAALVELDANKVPGYGFASFKRHMQSHILRIPQFRWKLHEVPFALDLPYWVEDQEFDLGRHIRRIALPSPGDDRALAELAAYLYSRHLDRRRPLWEIWFIEGLGEGRFAFLQKVHHCMMDGEAASRLTEMMWDYAPDSAMTEIDPEIAGASAGDIPEFWQQSLNTAVHLSRSWMRVGAEACDTLLRSLAKRRPVAPWKPAKASAPGSCINADIGPDRGLVFGSVALADIKTVRRHFSVTVNDVLLALVGSSLRDYLLARDELPGEALRTSIAVSLRSAEDDKFSNRITTTTVTLATDLADPRERLRAISQEALRAKDSAHHGGTSVLEIMQMLPPLAITAMIHLAPAQQIPRLMGVNLIVSNIRGSDKAMYVGGARAKAIYPVSIISPGGGLNVTCLSYAGRMHFGLTIEPRLVPEPWTLMAGIRRALKEYKVLARAAGDVKRPGGGDGS